MTWEQLVAADPDVIVIAPCGFDLARTAQELHFMTARPGWSGLRARKYPGRRQSVFQSPGPARGAKRTASCARCCIPERFAPSLSGVAWRAI